MTPEQDLETTLRALTQTGKGLLAADESTGTITRRFAAVGVESTAAMRRDYRELLLGTQGIGDFISGVILFEETLGQHAADGTALPALARRQGMVPGIKVDRGLVALAHTDDEQVTAGLDGLSERLAQYRLQGACFAKWRAVFRVAAQRPSALAIAANAEVLARYAASCQEQGVVPIVEPEVLMEGDHSIERCAQVTEAVLHAVFAALLRHRVVPEQMLLKPNMVVSGRDHPAPAGPERVAEHTLRILRRTVPAAVPSINFLSGGQSPAQATANLNAMHAAGSARAPWALSFSFARALQEPVLAAWCGRAENVPAAQRAFYRRALLAGAACRGSYASEMEHTG